MKTELTEEQDTFRLLNELAILQGRRMQSDQTGFIHCFYSYKEGNEHQTIPVFENFLFALALFRSRLIDNVNEAKKIVERLIAFQNKDAETSGNFPIYLHEYPHCFNSLVAVSLLPIFYWILKDFGHILGGELKEKVESASRNLLNYSQEAHQKKALPYSLAVQYSSSCQAFGTLWKETYFVQEGKTLLNELCEMGHVDSWHSTNYLSEILVGLQMLYPSLEVSPWSSFWNYLNEVWHPEVCCYLGPCLTEEQRGYEPEINLFDFYMGTFSSQFSERMMRTHYCHLQTVLIQPTELRFSKEKILARLEGQHRDAEWLKIAGKNWGAHLLEKESVSHSPQWKTYLPFRLVWGNPKKTNSFVCQAAAAVKVHYEIENEKLYLFFHIDQSCKEINFYVNYDPAMKLNVNDGIATVFEQNDLLKMQTTDFNIDFAFECLESSSHILGHIKRGNRPSQILSKEKNPYDAYDWHLVLRTVRCSKPSVIKVSISLSC